MAARCALARKKALALLEAGSVFAPPVPVEALATLAGAVIRFRRFDGQGEVAGLLHRGLDARAVIGVNRSQPLPRRRFTIAHELGHLLLHAGQDFHFDENFAARRDSAASQAASDSESEANQFAVHLLMPATLLQVDVAHLSFDSETDPQLGELAKRYGVSPQAMTIRLSRLNLIH